MARDQYEYDVGGELRDRYGRPEFMLLPRHAAPLTGDVSRGYQPADADGRLQVVALDGNGNDLAPALSENLLSHASLYGAVGDAGTGADGAVNVVTNPTLLSTAQAAQMKVGQLLYVAGAGSSGTVLQTTVASLVDSTHVIMANNASTTVAAAAIVYGTNNYVPFTKAIAANVNGQVLVGRGTFLVDNGRNGSASTYFTVPGTVLDTPGNPSITFRGPGPEVSTIRFGPEGLTTNTASSTGFGIASYQSLLFENIGLRAPDIFGTNAGAAGGPPSNFPTTGWQAGDGGLTFVAPIDQNFHASLKLSYVHTKGASAVSVTRGSIDVDHSLLEGSGAAYASMGIFCGSDGTDGYTPAKYLSVSNSRLTGFGDPQGNPFYHSWYAETDHDIFFSNVIVDTPAPGSAGNLGQHYDTQVAFANAGRHAVYSNCHFEPGSQTGVRTSYQCVTHFSDVTMPGLTQSGIVASSLVIVKGGTYTITGVNGAAVSTITREAGQGTDMGYGFTITGGARIRLAASVAASLVQIADANAGDLFTIDDTVVFEMISGATGTGNYVLQNNVNSVVVCAAKFTGHPSVALREFNGNTLTADNAKFLMSGGTTMFQNGGALTRFNMHNAEIASGPALPNFGTFVTTVDMYNNYGAGWAGVLRNVKNSTYTILPYDVYVLTTATGGFTKTLPAASSVPAGNPIRFKNTSGVADTISRAGADTIDGATTATVAATTGRLVLASNGVNGWDIVG